VKVRGERILAANRGEETNDELFRTKRMKSDRRKTEENLGEV
jgi:hypothetical protein